MSILFEEYNSPEMPIEPPELGVLCYCSRCLQEIYEGEYYGLDGQDKPVCIDCAESEFNRLSAEEKILALGMEVRS